MPENMSYGTLRIQVISRLGIVPIPGAILIISSTDGPAMNDITLTTDVSGISEIITLPAPAVEYSMNSDQEIRPYAIYNLEVIAQGYEPVFIQGMEILPGELALQQVVMNPLEISDETEETILIPPHTLYGDYPPKIPEAEIKPLPESGEIVLSRAVIPEYIIVHDGVPDDASAPNYWVKYTDYIKNVASSEIYATWPESTLYANILAIMSFTLNRVFTEWYRGRGYNFTITSSTAYDQKWIRGRNTYARIDELVDSIFNNYLARPGVLQPIFTSYCDGKNTTCNGLSQWGSKYLGDEGYSAIEIIRYYYGNDMYIATAERISGVPSSFPGYTLSQGSSGEKVRQLQEQLNRIGENYPALPRLAADGIYGPRTAEAVSIFQNIFSLPQTGTVDFATWYAISRIYVGVSRIAEPG
ncbi:MAG: peptidoglycan-binding protein [Lachnospiraceae bacterium]|nr:peptidoglycan-binding protein [Lachnospiraceae bacterium]